MQNTYIQMGLPNEQWLEYSTIEEIPRKSSSGLSNLGLNSISIHIKWIMIWSTWSIVLSFRIRELSNMFHKDYMIPYNTIIANKWFNILNDKLSRECFIKQASIIPCNLIAKPINCYFLVFKTHIWEAMVTTVIYSWYTYKVNI